MENIAPKRRGNRWTFPILHWDALASFQYIENEKVREQKNHHENGGFVENIAPKRRGNWWTFPILHRDALASFQYVENEKFKKQKNHRENGGFVENIGVEPMTFWLPAKRSSQLS